MSDVGFSLLFMDLRSEISLYNFMFNSSSADHEQPWFIDASSGEKFVRTQVKARTDFLAAGLQAYLSLGRDSKAPEVSEVDYEIHDVVCVVSSNSVDFGPVVWASHKLGCTVASSNASSTSEELQYQFKLSGAKTIFAHIDTLDRVLAAAVMCGISSRRIVVIAATQDDIVLSKIRSVGAKTVEELIAMGVKWGHEVTTAYCNPLKRQIAFLCFSSGTTGLSKAVVIPHSSVIANILQVAALSIPGIPAPNDRALGVIPFSHMYGLLTLVHLCPHVGISTVVFPSMPPFDRLLEDIVRFTINHLYLAPPLVKAFVKHPATSKYDLGFLKTCMIAAAPLDAETEAAFRRLGGPNFLVTQGFGLTETAGLCTGLPVGSASRPGSVGCLVPFTNAKIIDDNGNVVGPGQCGQLCVQGPQLCLGYLNNLEANSTSFDDEGFLLTGDVAEMSKDGYICVVDRLKHMIKTKGFQVSPAELEGHLMALDIVQDVGVVGKKDDRCGEIPVAFIVLSGFGREQAALNPDVVKDKIKLHVQATKSTYKWLQEVYFVQCIPKLPSGKILVRHLQEIVSKGPVLEYMPIIQPEPHSLVICS